MIEGIWPLLQQHHFCKPAPHMNLWNGMHMCNLPSSFQRLLQLRRFQESHSSFRLFSTFLKTFPEVASWTSEEFIRHKAPPRHTAGARQCVARAASPHHTSVSLYIKSRLGSWEEEEEEIEEIEDIDRLWSFQGCFFPAKLKDSKGSKDLQKSKLREEHPFCWEACCKGHSRSTPKAHGNFEHFDMWISAESRTVQAQSTGTHSFPQASHFTISKASTAPRSRRTVWPLVILTQPERPQAWRRNMLSCCPACILHARVSDLSAVVIKICSSHFLCHLSVLVTWLATRGSHKAEVQP